MGAARAVVSTTVGAEGLEVTHNENILLHDDAPAFAEAVIALLRDEVARRRLGLAAKQLAERHDWSRVIGGFERALEQAIAAHAAETS
jgi:glycosyltransferase involved in cell wall biosynthesis